LPPSVDPLTGVKTRRLADYFESTWLTGDFPPSLWTHFDNLPRCHWDKNYTWQKELRSHRSNNLEQSSDRSATPLAHLAVTAVIWTKTETVFVWVISAPEEFCLSRAIQMFALLLLLLLLTVKCLCKWYPDSRFDHAVHAYRLQWTEYATSNRHQQ